MIITSRSTLSPGARAVLKENVERSFARGATITEIMTLYRLSYELAHDMRRAMRCQRTSRRCHRQEMDLPA